LGSRLRRRRHAAERRGTWSRARTPVVGLLLACKPSTGGQIELLFSRRKPLFCNDLSCR